MPPATRRRPTAVTVTVLNDTTAPTVGDHGAGERRHGRAARSTVSATASDNVGVVGVQFRLDGATLGAEDTTAPYAVAWDTTTASNGAHTLTAVARDAAGNTTTSAAVTVTVLNDTTAPTVGITAPANGATVSGTMTVGATASDNVGVVGVQFRLDGATLGAEDTTAPYSIAWDTTTASNGAHTLTAVARDAAGNTTTSAAVTVTVANNTGTTIRIEDTTTAVSFFRVWTQNYTGTPGGWSGGSVAFSVEAAARATLTFNGTGANWIGWRGPQTGHRDRVSRQCGGRDSGRVHADEYRAGRPLYSSPPLAAGIAYIGD